MISRRILVTSSSFQMKVLIEECLYSADISKGIKSVTKYIRTRRRLGWEWIVDE